MRIVVIGVSASGKTTFTRRLSEKLDLSAYFADEIMWRPGWKYIGDEETAKRINGIIAKEHWIFEGYITSQVRSKVFERADCILYLDYPGWISALRYIKRWWKHRKKPRKELPGSPEKFSFKFLKLVYTKGEVWKVEKIFREHDWESKIIRFKSPAQAEEYLKKL